MNLDAIKKAVVAFIEREKTAFQTMAWSESQALEIGALMLTAEHYHRGGFRVRPVGLKGGFFRLKLSAKGYPMNFSWFEVERGDRRYEIHGNISVQSATEHDDGVYVVDVGVVRPNSTPRTSAEAKAWKGVRNKRLITFVEAKKLVIYPMLLAQFVGIVHEIKPGFLAGKTISIRSAGHFFPALVSVGYLKATSEKIVSGYGRRAFRLNIVPTFDDKVTAMAGDPLHPSPFRPHPRRVPTDDDIPF